MWTPVLIAIAIVAIVALLAFRWFERYRYTDAWRHGELRGWAFGFLMWFGGIFGHRLPPPPQANVEFASKRTIDAAGESGGATFADDASNQEE